MPGTLLISPTGSGKSWFCDNDPFYRDSAMDGDPLIDWHFDWGNADWVAKDRQHLDIVLGRMRSSGKCVCWYVGTTAIPDALRDGRLAPSEVLIVILPEDEHRKWVLDRGKRSHDWSRALEHRRHCESLVESFDLPCFDSFLAAAEHLKTRSTDVIGRSETNENRGEQVAAPNSLTRSESDSSSG